MAGFFEIIARETGNRHLLAAWMTEGENAGARVLLDQENVLFRDDGFPAELAEGIRISGADHEGITNIKGTPVFLDHLPGGRRLVICGAGHVALCVIRLGVMLGYEVTVIEDREEFAEKAREAGAGRNRRGSGNCLCDHDAGTRSRRGMPAKDPEEILCLCRHDGQPEQNPERPGTVAERGI